MKNIIKKLVLILTISIYTNLFSQSSASALKFNSDLDTKFRFDDRKIDLKIQKSYSENRDQKLACIVSIFAGVAFTTASALQMYDANINKTAEIRLPTQIMMGVGIGFTLGGTIGLLHFSGR